MRKPLFSMLHNFVSALLERHASLAPRARILTWRTFRIGRDMATNRPNAATLRAEARLLSVAGFTLLAISFPPTLWLAAHALLTEGASPFLPVAVGAPPLMLGYLACHFASQRMVRARAIEATGR
jgi:hypothetical protein